MAFSSEWGVALVLAGALSIAPATARGTPQAGASRTSSLSWVRLPGAEGCATAPELARAVEARLDREVFVAPRNAELSVEGRVAPRSGGGFTATFSVATAAGEVLGQRELEINSGDCAELTATVAFVVAVMIDPDAQETQETQERPSDAAVAVETVPPETVVEDPPRPAEEATPAGEVMAPPPAEDEGPPSGWAGEVDLGLGVAVGVVPEPAIGGFGAIVIQTPWFIAVEFGASLYPYSPQSTPTGDARWLAAFGSLLLCSPELPIGAFGLRGCAGGEIGFLRLGGVIDPAQEHIAGHVLLRARLAYRPWKGLVIWARPTLGINPRTDPFVYPSGASTTTLHTPESVFGLFDLGLGWIFD